MSGAWIDVTADGLALLVPVPPPNATMMSTFRVDVAWADLALFAPSDPWPALTVSTRANTSHHLRPVADAREAFERAVEAAAAAVEERAPSALRPGWLAIPRVEWAPTDEWPTELPGGDGAFRTAAGRADPLIALRPGPASFERMLDWLAGTPPAQRAGEIALTPRFVYTRRHGERPRRLPRETIRRLERTDPGDVVVTFGRSTRLVLPFRPHCPVVEHLSRAAPR